MERFVYLITSKNWDSREVQTNSRISMSTLIATTALILGVTGDIKYPAICKDTYLSDKRVENAEKAEKALIRKPGCMRIGNEVITEGDRAGENFSIFTCCTPL